MEYVAREKFSLPKVGDEIVRRITVRNGRREIEAMVRSSKRPGERTLVLFFSEAKLGEVGEEWGYRVEDIRLSGRTTLAGAERWIATVTPIGREEKFFHHFSNGMCRTRLVSGQRELGEAITQECKKVDAYYVIDDLVHAYEEVSRNGYLVARTKGIGTWSAATWREYKSPVLPPPYPNDGF